MLKSLALIAAFLAGPALSEGSELKAMITGDDSRGWDAVGRIDIGSRAFCTGALIAEDLVLTAGHCLFERSSNSVATADEIQFLAGWRGGRAAAYRGARRVVVHPDYIADSADRSVDLALIELDRPIRNISIQPFETTRRRLLLREVGVVSYAHDRSEAASIQDTCHVLGRVEETLVLDCEVDFGSSGAPVFDLSQETPRIISVVSAKGEVGDQKVSLGTDLLSPLAELKALLASGDAVLHQPRAGSVKIDLGTSIASTGAKVVRP